jgi:hypothetical protein
MNDFDKENLWFFLTADADTLKDWIEWADDRNMAYAMNLIKGELSRLHLEALELMDNVEHTDDADRVILDIMEKFDTK